MLVTTVTVAVAVVGLLITIATILGAFRMSRSNSAMTGYRDAAASWEAKAKAQEAEISDLRTDLATANASIEALTKRVQMLQDMVTSRTLVEALAHTMETQHTTVMGHLEALEVAIRRLAGGTT
jgi:uncharacterized protein (UPF0276 family)